MSLILEATELKKYYGSGSNLVKAVDHISFSVEKGEFVAIVGKSGSGKSTLLNLIGGLDSADSGSVMIQGKELFDLSEEERTVFRRRNIGFVFQNYNLLPTATVYKNIILPIQLDNKKVDKTYLDEVIEKLELTEKLRLKPNQLSGGQQQRVAIARALAAKPAMILADEPTGNLDTHNSSEVIALLKKTSKKYEQTIIMITHNRGIALTADRVLEVQDGVLTDLGRCCE